MTEMREIRCPDCGRFVLESNATMLRTICKCGSLLTMVRELDGAFAIIATSKRDKHLDKHLDKRRPDQR